MHILLAYFILDFCVFALMVNNSWSNRLVIIDVKNLLEFGIVTWVETHCGRTTVRWLHLILYILAPMAKFQKSKKERWGVVCLVETHSGKFCLMFLALTSFFFTTIKS